MLTYFTHPVVMLTIGGAIGTNARYWLGRWIALHHWTEHFPLATFTINITGSLLLGLFYLPFHNRLPGWWLLLGVGFCGGYTTFSTFSLETVELIRKHQHGIALLNIVASVVVGCAMTWLALVSMEQVVPRIPPPMVTAAEDAETQTVSKTSPPDSASDNAVRHP